jgi:acyl carrier protein
MQENIRHAIRTFILDKFLPGEDPNELKDSTPLITGGILDSLATLKLVAYLEDEFKVTFEAHDTDRDNFDTIADITRLVLSKLDAKRDG